MAMIMTVTGLESPETGGSTEELYCRCGCPDSYFHEETIKCLRCRAPWSLARPLAAWLADSLKGAIESAEDAGGGWYETEFLKKDLEDWRQWLNLYRQTQSER